MPDPDLWPEIKRKTRDLARTDTDLKIGYRVQIKYSLTLTFQSSQNNKMDGQNRILSKRFWSDQEQQRHFNE